MKIKLIGFDLDGTLYKPNEKINKKIRDYLCKRAGHILNKSYHEIKDKFNKLYKKTQSGTDSLRLMEIKNSSSLTQEALENVDITPFLKKDLELLSTLYRLKEKYKLFLITGSPKKITNKKLRALGINSKIFSIKIYDNSSKSKYKRKDGSAFIHISKLYNIPLYNMMFIGDREKIDIIPAKKLNLKTVIINAKSKIADFNLKKISELEKILL